MNWKVPLTLALLLWPSVASPNAQGTYQPLLLASAAINNSAIDGTAVGSFTAAISGTVTLTTVSANDVIYLATHNEDLSTTRPVASVTSPNLTWTHRTTQNWIDAGGAGLFHTMDVWSANNASSPLSSEVITVTLTSAIANGGAATMMAFGISGNPSPSSPWDTNGSVPAFGHGVPSPNSFTLTISTDSTIPMIISFMGTGGFPGAGVPPDPPAGFTLVHAVESACDFRCSSTSVSYQNFNSALSSTTFGAGTGDHLNSFGMIIDALK